MVFEIVYNGVSNDLTKKAVSLELWRPINFIKNEIRSVVSEEKGFQRTKTFAKKCEISQKNSFVHCKLFCQILHFSQECILRKEAKSMQNMRQFRKKKLQNVPKKRIINSFFATECEKMRNYIFSRKMITLLKKALKEV